MKQIRTRTPVRIDLAGGTVDIWPLYLLIPRATTLNLAIDLYAEVTLKHGPKPEKKGDPEVILRSGDQSAEMVFSWKELFTRDAPPALILHQRLLRHFAERHPKKRPKYLVLETRATSPAGAGLGGSSSINIALTGALASLFLGRAAVKSESSRTSLIEIARDIETQILGVPAGLQDYYGAMFGGLQELSWGVQTHGRKNLKPKLLKELSSRLLLFYSGQSRNSGINNWQLFKSMIEKDRALAQRFATINSATHGLREALLKSDWTEAMHAINREWQARRELAPGISTPEIDRALEKAKRETEVGFKICGAGGGGCFFIYLPKPDAAVKERIIQQLSDGGIRNLPFNAASKGLDIR